MAAHNNKLKIRTGDVVVVISGKQKKTTGRVVRVLPGKRQVVVEGVRVVTRHQKPAGDRPGGVLQKEMPIDVSNVALWNETEKRRVKVGFEVRDGRKVRIDKKSGAVIDKG